jgi:hypothetical protein
MPAFMNDDINKVLAGYGYTGNPAGLVRKFPSDYVVNGDVAYLDINADAVRMGDKVPDRPVRITYHKTFDGILSRWELKSIEELPKGVQSNALDRQPETGKVSPWPE